jgi:oligopeptide transport system ATP-binding protein
MFPTRAISKNSGVSSIIEDSFVAQEGQEVHVEPLLSARSLYKSFRVKGESGRRNISIDAVAGVDLDIYEGEVLGLVGESGCGKSTLGRALLWLDPPTSGTLKYRGRDFGSMSSRERRALRQNVQVIFQDPHSSLNPRMSVGDLIREPLDVHGLGTAAEREKRVADLLDMVGLSTRSAGRYPHEFSGGQRQRIGIARALATNPEFIVCDEAVSALDVSIQAQILNLLSDLRDELSLTYLFVSHNLAVIEHISTRVVVMYLGKIVEIATVEELYRAPKHPYTKALLSAVPVPDPALERQRKRIILEGDLPSLVRPPSGCRFHRRCKYATEICKTDVPSREKVTSGHEVFCHNWKEIA